MLTVSDYRVSVKDEFDLWPVYSGERFRASFKLFVMYQTIRRYEYVVCLYS